MNKEEWTKRVVRAKRRVQVAAGATSGRIGNPGDYLLGLIEWAESHDMEDDASLLRESWVANWGPRESGMGSP